MCVLDFMTLFIHTTFVNTQTIQYPRVELCQIKNCVKHKHLSIETVHCMWTTVRSCHAGRRVNGVVFQRKIYLFCAWFASEANDMMA